MMNQEQQNIIIYNTADGKASVQLHARDGMVWMSQGQLAVLFDTSKQNIGQHVANILKEKELDENSVIKNYFTTAADGKKYQVIHYSLEMILATGFRAQGKISHPRIESKVHEIYLNFDQGRKAQEAGMWRQGRIVIDIFLLSTTPPTGSGQLKTKINARAIMPALRVT